jgi:hypothetical protein
MQVRPKLHRDGSMTFWSVLTQSWRHRVHDVTDGDLAAMPEADRLRILRHMVRHMGPK